MHPTLFVLAIALAGCGDDAAPADLGTPDLAVGDLSQIVCTTSCGTCASGTTCVTNSSPSVNQFSATCLATCQTDADCTGQRACVAFDGSAPSGRYCLSATDPPECGTHCDLVQPTSACEGSTLVSVYHTTICGLRYTHCANGCVEDAPDGGVDRQAHCS
jgi:hypothetical protein